MEQEIKEISDDIKDQKEMLAQELADYYKDTGDMKIKDSEGNEKRIIFSAKLVSAWFSSELWQNNEVMPLKPKKKNRQKRREIRKKRKKIHRIS